MEIGRNDPCPCGSGRKYKVCCLAKPADAMEHAARRARSVQDQVEPAVFRFGRLLLGEAMLDLAWQDFVAGFPQIDPQGPEIQLFNPWFLYDWAPKVPGRNWRPNGPTLAQLYLEEHHERLSPAEDSFLRRTSSTPMSFHDVLSVERGRRVRLRDALLGAEHEVFEQSGSETLQVGDVLFARVVAYEGVALMIGSGSIPLPPIEKATILRMREHLVKEFGRLTPEMIVAASRQLLTLYFNLRERVLNPTPPILRNTDDETIEFHTLTWDIESPGEAFQALKSLAKGESEEDLLREAAFDEHGRLSKTEFAWLKAGNKVHRSWENTVLGHVSIDGKRLKVEVNSAGRARRAQREVRKRLGASARNLTDRIKPVEEALGDYEKIKDTPEERSRREREEELRAAPEIQAAMRELAERHWQTWLQERIPLLDGKTPVEAVRTREGREMVEALLLDVERTDRGPDVKVHLDRVRRELGLEP